MIVLPILALVVGILFIAGFFGGLFIFGKMAVKAMRGK